MDSMTDVEGVLKLVNPGSIGGVAGSILASPIGKRLADAGVDYISSEGRRIASEVASKIGGKNPFIKILDEFGDTGGDSGGSVGGSGSSSNPFSVNRMNYNPKPVQVRLDTGIRSKGFGDYYPVSKPSINVLELTQLIMEIPISQLSGLYEYFKDVIAFNFQNVAQSKISFNVNAVTNFTAAKLQDWLNAYCLAYSKYVFYTAVIGYSREPLQQNEGMRALRAMMTPALLDDLQRLENMLEGTPAPPKFRELIHFIYGAPFKTSGNPGASIRMITPSVLQRNTNTDTVLTLLPANDLNSAISSLFAVRETTALIARCFPEWLPGVGQVAAGNAVCEFSPNWHTLFENAPYHNETNGTSYYGPSVANLDTDAVYGSMADTLDGAITALWNGYYESSSEPSDLRKFLPGTLIPAASVVHATDPSEQKKSNRISFKYDSTADASGFYLDVQGTNQYRYMRMETELKASNGTTHRMIWPGRELINNINVNATRETAYELYSRMFDVAKPAVARAERGGKGRRRSKGKGKADTDSMTD